MFYNRFSIFYLSKQRFFIWVVAGGLGPGGGWGLLGSGPLLQFLMFHKLFNLFNFF